MVIEVHETAFRAMGSPCRIVADGDPSFGPLGEAMVHDLEARWSRFSAASEVSRANALAGVLVVVSPATFRLIATAQEARAWTSGFFDPLMLDQLVGLGYSRDWQLGPRAVAPDGITTPQDHSTAHGELEMFESLPAVVIPAGSRFDPGGIGKGLAADMVCERLLELGAETVMVDMGGDVRMAGTPWYGDEWAVNMVAPQQRSTVTGTFTLAPGEQMGQQRGGAVATSSVVCKRWTSDGTIVHHILDPRSGRPADADLVTVTLCAPTAWQAEVAAKCGLIVGSGGFVSLCERLGVHGVAIDHDGHAVAVHSSPATHRVGGH